MLLHFKDKSVFDTQDIVEFYERTDLGIPLSTVNWRIYTLVQSGIFQRIGRGKFRLGEGKNYIPEISSSAKSVFKKLKAEFPYATLCIWNTSALNEFMLHQPNRFFLLIETDKEVADSVFYFLRGLNKSVFINPSIEILEKYMVRDKETIIVKTLVSESPTQTINKIETTTLEKILVDIFCDDTIFSAYQGAEMRTIFKEALAKYTINQSKMFRYADRRGKKGELNQFLNNSNLWQ